METTIRITSWKGGIVVVGLVVFAFFVHHCTYYHNPKLDETITALQSDEPAIIAQALLKPSHWGWPKGIS